MGLTDIYFILFRRKWLILAGLVLGIAAAAAVWKVRQPLYQSQAKLLVKYVIDTRSLASLGSDAQVRATDSTGANIINSEVEILTSFDVAQEVAAVLTPEKVLPKTAKVSDPSMALAQAAGFIAKNLRVDPPRSSIITLRFEHPEPAAAKPILEQVIETYFKKHRQVHRAGESFDEVLVQRRDQLRSQLSETEEQLKQIKAKAGVVSLDEAKKTHAEQMAAIQEALFAAQAEQAQRRAALNEMRRLASAHLSSGTSAVSVASVPQAQIDEYRRIGERVDELDKRQRLLEIGVTLENPQARTNHLQLVEARRLKAALERQHPELLQTPLALGTGAGPLLPNPGIELASQGTSVLALDAKIHVLSNQLASVRAEATKVDEVETAILDLQRKKALIETQYLYVERGLQQAGFDQALGAGKSANISPVQAPSPPFQDFKKLRKTAAMALTGGLGAGIALAFLIELFLNRTLKRSKEVEGCLQVPLFLSIPILSLNGAKRPALKNGETNSAGNSQPDVLPGKRDEALKPFNDALRDRLVSYFEVREMTHKPKMIAVTSSSEGAGVSSIATGLAASLSETGDGNVLLVDMRGERGAAHAFYNGNPGSRLSDALETETRTSALVHENLYVVSTDTVGQKSPSIMPRQFSQMVPKLKASDYDYIIFDMPPVGQTTITAKVAKFMDMVLMVIESEKTDRDVARRAGALLAESKANVAAIFNKHRRYVPAWLQQDLQ
jgi:succinoglycan biosynthesis transport protein ExoP